MKDSYNNKKIKQATQMIKQEITFIQPDKEEEFIYEIDYRGEYDLCWIVCQNIETKKNLEII